ncbi:hypothetical protein JYU34_017943 [Plutella xylostella]|uniref:Uncharacterized protein n=1 Tax=Plutella xylostella TaxID=51655 RepID=A0ABQ7PZL1_PLUXY|nr:hypothetical protein JYU34_017943 [Plutella xylostella]
MATINTKMWAGDPNVCRCCLSMTGDTDLTAENIINGHKEVFSDMLHQCFGVYLSRLTDLGCSRWVCQACVQQLRAACAFRKQVVDAEECVVAFFEDNSGLQDKEIKSEIEDDDFFDTENRFENLMSKKKVKHKIHKKRGDRRTRMKDRDSTDDSDTPLTELSRLKSVAAQNEPLVPEDKDQFCVESLEVKHDFVFGNNDLNDNVDKTENDSPTIAPVSPPKHISERKKVIQTCNTVLKHTTACPFRHHKSWFQCFYCLEEFREIKLLRQHTSQKHQDIDKELKKIKRFPRSLQIDISELNCIDCVDFDVNLNNITSLKEHLISRHNLKIYTECIADYKVNTSPYTCHICKLEFHVFRSLTTHLNEHYANCICDVCGKSFINSKRLKVHKRTHESGAFPCNLCGKVLKTKTSKANHMETHSKRILKCQICSQPMKHYNDRVKHMSEVHNITHKFKCPVCPKEYNIRHYLATHMRQTHGNKNKKCAECGMAFITNHSLKKHMLKHSGEKPYECNVCRKAYARSYTLKEHMRSHENEGF